MIMKVKFVRDRVGDYYTEDGVFQIEKGTVGWNVNRLDRFGGYMFDFGTDTLKEAKDSIRWEYEQREKEKEKENKA